VRKASSPRRADLRSAGPWLPIAILALVAVLGWSLYPALRLQYQTSRRAAGLEEQYRSLRDRNAALSAEVAELKTPQGVEKAAREKLGYTKTGENVYVVIPDGSTAASGVTTASMAGAPADSILQTLLDAIFGVAQTASPGVEP
jgi:cell division protein FtsB